MFQTGWVKIHRKILDSRYGKNLEMIGLWTVLLLKANHKNGFTHDGTEIQKGQLMCSQSSLASNFNIDRSKMRRMLKGLEKAEQIKQQTSSKNTIISILNYDKYQFVDQLSEQLENSDKTSLDQLGNSNETPSEHQCNTNKNDNNNKKNNNKNIYKHAEEIINFWNGHELSEAKLIPPTVKAVHKAIEIHLSNHRGLIQIKKAIGNYSEVFHSQESYYTHEFSLVSFLSSMSADKFFDEKFSANNFKKKEKADFKNKRSKYA